MVANAELRNRFDALIRKAFSLLKSYLDSGEQIRQIYDDEYKIEPGGYSKTTVLKILFFDFIYEHQEELERLPEFSSIQELVSRDSTLSKHIGNMVGTGYGLMRMDLWDYLRHMLQRLVEAYSEQKKFDETLFEKLYEDFEKFIYSETISVTEIVPLHNFSSEEDEIRFCDKLRIRKITNNEKEGFLKGATFSGWPQHEMIHGNYVIELKHEMKKLFHGDTPSGGDPAVSKAIDGMLIILRLFKAGNVGHNLVQSSHDLDVHAFIGGGTRGGFIFQRFIGNEYVLKREEVEPLIDLYNSIPTELITREKSIELAVRRLGFAYGRITHEDKVIDLMIAYEALFFRKSESGEQRHKLAVRAARLLRQKFDERKELFREIKEFYDKRSILVHASESTTPADLTKMEDYLRTSIKSFIFKIAEGKKHEDIIFELDLA
jgi:hypothetical protein